MEAVAATAIKQATSGEREPTAFGRFVLTHLERRGQSLRGLTRATGMSFDRVRALLYGRHVPAGGGGGRGQHAAVGSTFLLTGLYSMASYLGIPAIELLIAFYGRDREIEACVSHLLDRFLRLDREGQATVLSVLDSLVPGHEITLSEETCSRLSSLSLGRSTVRRVEADESV